MAPGHEMGSSIQEVHTRPSLPGRFSIWPEDSSCGPEATKAAEMAISSIIEIGTGKSNYGSGKVIKTM
jgi:hypothetical protein